MKKRLFPEVSGLLVDIIFNGEQLCVKCKETTVPVKKEPCPNCGHPLPSCSICGRGSTEENPVFLSTVEIEGILIEGKTRTFTSTDASKDFQTKIRELIQNHPRFSTTVCWECEFAYYNEITRLPEKQRLLYSSLKWGSTESILRIR